MSDNKNFLSIKLFKTILISSIVSVLILILILVMTSVVLRNITGYDNYYSIISIIAYCLVGLISTKLTTSRFSHSLLPVAFFQSLADTLLILAISVIVSKSFPRLSAVGFSLLIITGASVIAILFNKNRRKTTR